MFKIYTKFGVGIAVVLIVYFILLKLVGLHKYPVLSALNGVIYAAGIWMAMRNYQNNPKYEKGFTVGVMTGGLATIIFTVFMAIFMFQIDTEFAVNLVKNTGFQYASGATMLLVALVIMGFATSFVLSLTYMQLLKKSWNTPEGKRNTLDSKLPKN